MRNLHRRHRRESHGPDLAVLATAHRQSLATTYRDGLRDGITMTLTLLLGREADGGVPYRGELPAGAREWAEGALAAVGAPDPPSNASVRQDPSAPRGPQHRRRWLGAIWSDWAAFASGWFAFVVGLILGWWFT